MQIRDLFEQQAKLDAFIEQTKQVTYDVFQQKSLALLVELAELANETRCFKYWSTKGPSERTVILEEFVDSIHFMLSLGNVKGYTLDVWPAAKQQADLTTLFIQATTAITRFIAEPLEVHYQQIWQCYSDIAYHLHFTVDDVMTAYYAKNEKNYERQRTGY